MLRYLPDRRAVDAEEAPDWRGWSTASCRGGQPRPSGAGSRGSWPREPVGVADGEVRARSVRPSRAGSTPAHVAGEARIREGRAPSASAAHRRFSGR